MNFTTKNTLHFCLSVLMAILIVSCKDDKPENSIPSTNLSPDSSVNDLPFYFPNNVSLSEEIESNALIISGINQEVSISITNGEYKINSQEYTSDNSTIKNGDELRLKMVSSDQWDTSTSLTLTISDQEFIFNTTTISEDYILDTTVDSLYFRFPANPERSTYVESTFQTVSGINEAVDISIQGGEYKINSGSYTSNISTVNDGDTLQLRLLTSDQWNKSSSLILTVGDQVFRHIITTRNEDFISDTTVDDLLFEFPDATPISTTIESNALRVSGLTQSVAISIEGGEYKIGPSDYSSRDSFIQSGDLLRLRTTTPSKGNTQSVLTLTISDQEFTFTFITDEQDITPDLITVEDVINADLNSLIMSDRLWVTGVTGDVDVSITNGEFSISGNSYSSTSTTIRNNQSIILRNLSSESFDTLTTTELIIGDSVIQFNVLTKPEVIEFDPQTNVTPNTYVLSNTVTVEGRANPTTISIIDGQYSIDGGEFTSAIGKIQNGQTLQIKQTSHLETGTLKSTTITVGDEPFFFETTTKSIYYNSKPVWEVTPIIKSKIITDIAPTSYSIEMVDLDKDGDKDLLCACWGDSTISWYENAGDDNFFKIVIADVVSGAKSIITADLNGDGFLDLISASYSNNTIAWYENDGAQNFTEQKIYTNAEGANSVFVIDLDKDGDLDILSASRNDDTVAWFENNGSQNFVMHVISNTKNNANSVVSSDLDNDGDLDILSGSLGPGNLTWFENDGTQNFAPHEITNTATSSTSLVVDDVNGDGYLDILAASETKNIIAWFENDGLKGFNEHIISSSLESPRSLKTADMDKDGDLDVLIGSNSDNSIVWFENDSNGNFHAHVTTDEAFSVYALTTSDIDSDGDLEIVSSYDDVFAWYDLNEIQYHLIEGTDQISTEIATDRDRNVLTYQLTDSLDASLINLDSETGAINFKTAPQFDHPLDLTGDNNYEFFISVNDGFHSISKKIGVRIYSSTDDDYDNDGFNNDLDLYPFNPKEWIDTDGDAIANNTDLDDDNDQILDAEDFSPLDANDTKGPVWNTQALMSQTYLISEGLNGIRSINSNFDMDGDGDIDLVSGLSDDRSISWYENDGFESFTKQLIGSNVSTKHSSNIDLDTDGDWDVVVASWDDEAIYWFENNGEFQFTRHEITTHEKYVGSLDVADVDGDGDLDIIASFSDKMIWYENDGNQTFTRHLILAKIPRSTKLNTVDLDKDGDLDLLTFSPNEDTVAWYENDGEQNFTRNIITDRANLVTSAVAADMDNDGNLDILVSSDDDNTVAWYQNNGSQKFSKIIISSEVTNPVSIKPIDMDLDGDLDVLVNNPEEAEIAWFENNDSLGFTKRIVSLIEESAYYIEVADLDGNGYLDLITPSYANFRQTLIWYNLIESQHNLVEGNTYIATESASDIDNNTISYYLVGGPDASLINIDSSTGALNFKTPPQFEDPQDYNFDNNYEFTIAVSDGYTTNTRRVAVQVYSSIDTDLDNDGVVNELDAFPFDQNEWSDTDGDSIGNNADLDDDNDGVSDLLDISPLDANDTARAIWLDPPLLAKSNLITNTAQGAMIAISSDIDNDGDLDVLSASDYDDTVAWYENNGEQNFTTHVISNTIDGASAVDTSDLDNDGDLDVIFGSGNDDRIGWFENDGAQNFTLHEIINSEEVIALKAIDLDQDGDEDIIYARLNGTGWIENENNNVFTDHYVSSAAYTGSIVAVDFDSDGDLDLLSTSYSENSVILLENDGAQNFTDYIITDWASGAKSVSTGDIDADGDIDVIASSATSDTISWYENKGNKNFTKHLITKNANFSKSVVGVDMDEDGDLDVLAAASADDTIFWYENNGNQKFIEHVITTNAEDVTTVKTADIDGDGDLDVLSASNDDNSIRWHDLTEQTYQITEGEKHITNITATDVDANILSYEVQIGPDVDHFIIDHLTGELNFKIAPIHASPIDFNRDNIYSLTITVNDGFSSTHRQIEIEVLPAM